MAGFVFKKATKTRSRLRMAIDGPSGSGKTFTSLKIAEFLIQLLAKDKKMRPAVLDSERGSAAKYSDLFEFDHAELEDHHPATYVAAIHDAEKAGYEVMVIDSLSHAWMGKDGALAQVDKVSARQQSKNSFTAWRDVTPMHNAMVDAILQSSMHIIVTMRSKTEYIMEADGKGKQAPRKVGLAPVQRDGMEYEFDVVGDMNLDNAMVIGKTRCHALARGVFPLPGEEVAKILAHWLGDESIPEKGPTKAEVEAAAKAALANDPEIVALFDKLDATPAKRQASIERYNTKEQLMNTLNERLDDREKEKAAKAAKAAEQAKLADEALNPKAEPKKETTAPT